MITLNIAPIGNQICCSCQGWHFRKLGAAHCLGRRRSFLSRVPEVPGFLDSFQHAANDPASGKLPVKGAAPSCELVRTGIEDVLGQRPR